MGYWVDLDHPYRTMDPEYVESVWWSLKQIHDKGLLVEDYRVTPYCPRCGTGLSDHELAQGYETVVDPSVYVRFPLTSRPVRRPGVAAGLDDDAVDAGVQHRGRGAPGRRPTSSPPTATSRWSWREPLLEQVLGEGWTVQVTVTGREMERLDLPAAVRAGGVPRAGRRTTSCSPTTSPPRTAPVWCTSPPRSARTTSRSAARTACRWSTRWTPTARSTPTCRWSAGSSSRRPTRTWSRTCERARAAVPARAVRAPATRTAGAATPPLMYYALPSWYIRTTQVKDALLRENEKTNWYPDSVKWGRYGDWLQQQHRLGAVPHPLLGYAAADLALRGRPPDLRRLAGRARPSWPARDLSRARPAPAVRRRHHLRLPDLRRRGAAGCPR